MGVATARVLHPAATRTTVSISSNAPRARLLPQVYGIPLLCCDSRTARPMILGQSVQSQLLFSPILLLSIFRLSEDRLCSTVPLHVVPRCWCSQLGAAVVLRRDLADCEGVVEGEQVIGVGANLPRPKFATLHDRSTPPCFPAAHCTTFETEGAALGRGKQSYLVGLVDHLHIPVAVHLDANTDMDIITTARRTVARGLYSQAKCRALRPSGPHRRWAPTTRTGRRGLAQAPCCASTSRGGDPPHLARAPPRAAGLTSPC